MPMSTGPNQGPANPFIASIEARTVHCIGPTGSFSEAAVNLLIELGIHQPGSQAAPNVEVHDGFNGIKYKVLHDESPVIGVMPLESDYSGAVPIPQNYLMQGAFTVLGEAVMKIEYVMASKGRHPDRLRKVYSHFKGQAACEQNTEAMNLQPVFTDSTSAAAKKIARRGNHYAAYCSREAATHFGLNILLDPAGIDTTTFVIVKAHDKDMPSLENLDAFDPDTPMLVTGLLAPTIPSEPNGYRQVMYFVDEASHNSITDYQRVIHTKQTDFVGGDREYLVTFKGRPDVLHEVLSDPRMNQLARLVILGTYPEAMVLGEVSTDTMIDQKISAPEES
jgi:prephenate dehydratase